MAEASRSGENQNILLSKDRDGAATITLNWRDRFITFSTELIKALNATFTLLPEDQYSRVAVLAANGNAYNAVEGLDAFTELQKPVWRHR